jgi:hypothetical protein
MVQQEAPGMKNVTDEKSWGNPGKISLCGKKFYTHWDIILNILTRLSERLD